MNQNLIKYLRKNDILELSLPLIDAGYFFYYIEKNIVVFKNATFEQEDLINIAKINFKNKGFDLVLLSDLILQREKENLKEFKKHKELIKSKLKGRPLLYKLLKIKYIKEGLNNDWEKEIDNLLKLKSSDIKKSYDDIRLSTDDSLLNIDIIMNNNWYIRLYDIDEIPNRITSLLKCSILYNKVIQEFTIPEIIKHLYYTYNRDKKI